MSTSEHLSEVSEQSKAYIDVIMDDVESVLSSNDISYVINTKGTEIRIDNSDLDKDSIKNMINESLVVPKPVLSLLIDIKSANGAIYIRQRRK